MEMNKENMYRNDFTIPQYKPRFIDLRDNQQIEIDNIGLSFPFGINIAFKPTSEDSDIARKTVIKLTNRRVLNSKECCGNCINESVKSIKEIKSDLVEIQLELANRSKTPLFYYVDYINIAINSFLDFMERNSESVELNKDLYFNALEKIRNHIGKCLKEIANIGSIEIDNSKYVYKSGNPEWVKTTYSESDIRTVDIIVWKNA